MRARRVGEETTTADWNCRICEHELAEDDPSCPNCGGSAHEAAHVLTPEAAVPLPSPPQAGGTDAGATGPPSQEESRDGRGRPTLMGGITICLLFLLVILAGPTGDGAGGGNPVNSPPERAETYEGVEGGGPDPEAKKPLEGEKVVVEMAEALVLETVNRLSRNYPPDLLAEAAREELLALKPRLEEALGVLEDIKRRRSLTEEELNQHSAFRMLLAYRG